MTNANYRELINLLKDYPNKKEVLDYIKSKNRCLGCRWNKNKEKKFYEMSDDRL